MLLCLMLHVKMQVASCFNGRSKKRSIFVVLLQVRCYSIDADTAEHMKKKSR